MNTSDRVMNYIEKQHMEQWELHDLYSKLRDKLSMRTFYQLTLVSPKGTMVGEHTDRFYEIIDDLVGMIVVFVNQRGDDGVVHHRAPLTDVFEVADDKKTVLGILPDFRDEQSLHNIVALYLGAQYGFKIEHFETGL